MNIRRFLLLVASLICIVSDTNDPGGTAVRVVHAETLPAVAYDANQGISNTHELIFAKNNRDRHQVEHSVTATCPPPRDISLATSIYHLC